MITKPRRFALGAMALGLSYACIVSCGGDDSTDTTADAGTGADGVAPVDGSMDLDSTVADSSVADTSSTDAGTVDRGPTKIAFTGDPNGLFWDYGVGSALYIADSAYNQIVKWTDSAGFGTTWALPYPGDGGPTLGQVIRLLDGTLLVTNFGYGSAGTVFIVDPTGDAGSLGALAVNKRRIGLAMLGDGTLVDTFFQKVDGGVKGGISKLSLAVAGGKETDLALGLSKPVGVVYNERRIYITDQNFGVVLQSGLDGGYYLAPDASVPDPDAGDADPGDGGDAAAPDAAAVPDSGPSPLALQVFANIASPDLLAQGPDGSLFTGNDSGTVFQIDRAGVVTPIITGLLGVRGLAYDGAHKRLFVAEHDPAGLANAIHIFPIP